MIVIKKSKNGQFFFVVKSTNGKILATSETYKRKSSCKQGVDALLYCTDKDRLITRDETKFNILK